MVEDQFPDGLSRRLSYRAGLLLAANLVTNTHHPTSRPIFEYIWHSVRHYLFSKLHVEKSGIDGIGFGKVN